jgi:hypothetical protein
MMGVAHRGDELDTTVGNELELLLGDARRRSIPVEDAICVTLELPLGLKLRPALGLLSHLGSDAVVRNSTGRFNRSFRGT